MVKRITPADGGQVVMPTSNVLALRARDPWKESTDKARNTAMQREVIVNAVQGMTADGTTQNNAVNLLLERAVSDIENLPIYLGNAIKATAKGKRKTPTRSTVCAWIAAYKNEGVPALLPEHKGRVVESSSWWGPALEYFNNPSKPEMSVVYRHLVEVDGFAVSYDQVCDYLNSVPAMLGKNSPARIGKNLYRLTQKQYVKRCTLNALAGDVYVADGYRADVYLAHPVTGEIWRPELSVAMDLRSRYIVGWRADEHEGTIAVQNLWAEALARWNHVPPFLYIDNGSGYKNHLLNDEHVGFYHRVGIQEVIKAIPGNPHGKGWIEKFFRHVKEDFIKLEYPAFYCGHDAAAEMKNLTVREAKAKRIQPPSLIDFTERFNQWLVRYHARPHPENKHETKAEVWQSLNPIPPHATVQELKRQEITRKVSRGQIRHSSRHYKHPDLEAFNGQQVRFEYDLMVNEVGVVRSLDGRWICDAFLVRTIDAVNSNRLTEKRTKAADEAIKRLEKKQIEQRARAGQVFESVPTDAALIEHEAIDDEYALSLTSQSDNDEGGNHDFSLDFDVD